MGKLSDSDTNVILRKLALLIAAFYAVYYLVLPLSSLHPIHGTSYLLISVCVFACSLVAFVQVSVIVVGAWGLTWRCVGQLPFYTSEDEFKPLRRSSAWVSKHALHNNTISKASNL